MKKFAYVLMTMCLLTLVLGCSGDKDKGMNRPDKHKDLPRAAPPENNK